MKHAFSRRYYRSTPTREAAAHKKDNQQEHSFFAAPSSEGFFKANNTIHRKCDHCEAEDKSIKRMGGPMEEEKKVQKQEEKKEEKAIQKMEAPKEEEKKVQKMEAPKEEEKKVQKMEAPKEEEKKVQKMEAPKEEEKKVQKMEAPKEEEKKVQKLEEKKEEDKTVNKQGDQEEKKLDKKDSGVAASNLSATGTYINSLSGKGQQLPREARHFFQKRMGHDFSQVKIHTGNEAEKSAKDINAKAYAVDNHIVFNKGQYNPSSTEGRKLLAHELAHIVQQQERGNEAGLLNRVAQLAEKRQEEEKPVTVQGKGTRTPVKTSYGCAGVQVQGQKDANYSSSFKTTGKSKPSEACTDCVPPDCISSKGTLVSIFKASPVITLPDVPDGLSKCEAQAVRTFINGTLKRHEQQHVAAFNTYTAVINTPYDFTGCSAELDSTLQAIHDGIDAQRAAAANALSDALDPFNVSIPCNCKED